MDVPVIQGFRYAVGLAVPLVASFTGPLSGLKELTEAQGFHALTEDQPAGRWAREQGWSNVVAYRRGRAPIAEPLSGGHDYVLTATRSGPDEMIDTTDPKYMGAIVWIERTDSQPGAAPKPGESSPDIPWGWIALGGAALVGVAAVVLSGDERPRRNPSKRSRKPDDDRWTVLLFDGEAGDPPRQIGTAGTKMAAAQMLNGRPGLIVRSIDLLSGKYSY